MPVDSYSSSFSSCSSVPTGSNAATGTEHYQTSARKRGAPLAAHVDGSRDSDVRGHQPFGHSNTGETKESRFDRPNYTPPTSPRRGTQRLSNQDAQQSVQTAEVSPNQHRISFRSSRRGIESTPFDTMALNSGAADFDTLRREATKLERYLEERVAKYQQLAHRLTTGDEGSDGYHPGGRVAPSSLLESAEAGIAHANGQYGNGHGNKMAAIEEEESVLAKDISRTIAAMSDLISTKMQPAAERSGKQQQLVLVKRYREILFDFSSDFKKTSAAVSRRREQMELFKGAQNKAAGDEGDPAMAHLLAEQNAISNSSKAAAEIIGQASEIRSDLRSQGQTLRGVTSKISAIASNVPGLNKLIESIRRKRSKDDMIVSGVIAFCVLFTLWYIFG